MKKISFALLFSLVATTAMAHDTIRLIVPFAAGGTTDKLARLLSQDFREQTGRTMIVENRPGAGGDIAANIVSSAPRSNTVLLMFGNPLIFALKPEQYSLSIFSPVAALGRLKMIVCVHPDSPIQTFRDLQKHNSKKSLTYSTSGKGSLSYLIGELLASSLDKNMVDVPYPGDAQRMVDILAGRTDIAILFTDQAKKYIKTQQLLPIVSLTEQRNPDLPMVPSIREFGITDPIVDALFFIVSNNPTNKEDVALIQKTLTQVLNDPVLSKPYKTEGLTIAAGSKALSTEQLQKEISRLQTLVKKTSMVIE
jgi:tripartite-type tricarboxylate transporter receptor subunit TctC